MAKIKLNNVRLSFPSLFRKATFEGNETKYEATFMLHKEEHADLIANIKKQIEAGIKENLKGAKIPSDKIALKDGDESGRDEYEGYYTLKAANNKRPKVVNRDKSPLAEDDEVIYSGCYVNAVVDPWYQSNGYGKRVNFNLLGVQFFKDGEPFESGSVADDDDFDEFEIDDDFDI
ncbi:MAG: ssDNA-binding protein [Pseudomonadales bacterium]